MGDVGFAGLHVQEEAPEGTAEEEEEEDPVEAYRRRKAQEEEVEDDGEEEKKETPRHSKLPAAKRAVVQVAAKLKSGKEYYNAKKESLKEKWKHAGAPRGDGA